MPFLKDFDKEKVQSREYSRHSFSRYIFIYNVFTTLVCNISVNPYIPINNPLFLILTKKQLFSSCLIVSICSKEPYRSGAIYFSRSPGTTKKGS